MIFNWYGLLFFTIFLFLFLIFLKAIVLISFNCIFLLYLVFNFLFFFELYLI